MAAGLATYQWNNQIKSIILLAGFPFLLVLMVFGFFFCMDMWLESPSGFQPGFNVHGGPISAGLWGVAHYGPYAVGLAFVWFIIAYFFHGSLMRMAAHSQPITRQQMPRIYNMLENLCISRGIPMPQFEVIDSPALNAFATGIDDKSYRIVLTRGIIERLHDDELEAVIGHELTHIMNRDARLLVIAVIFVGMISFFSQMLYRMLAYGNRPNYYRRSSNSKEEGNMLVVMLIALAILLIGYLFAVAIRFALSRRREFLADAGSVELTKNPEAMMKALLRISGNDVVTGMPNQIQEMCIENSHNFLGMFSTHPPIKARIEAISRMTNTPVPDLQVSLRRVPDEPWAGGVAPVHAAPQQPPAPQPTLTPAGPWGPRQE